MGFNESTSIHYLKYNNFFLKKLSTHSILPPLYYKTEYDCYTNYTSFTFYNIFLKPELLLFFKNLSIDTPHKFNIINSYKRTSFKTKLLRLNNYFFRDGKKNKCLVNFLGAYFRVFNQIRYNFLQTTSTVNDLRWYYSFFLCSLSPYFFSTLEDLYIHNGIKFDQWGLTSEMPLNRHNLFYRNFNKLDILFSFYIHKVDKHIYKNSRGKSGKFTFI